MNEHRSQKSEDRNQNKEVRYEDYEAEKKLLRSFPLTSEEYEELLMINIKKHFI
jgi:hypothetical protein